MKKEFQIIGIHHTETYVFDTLLAAIHQFLLDHPDDFIMGGRFIRVLVD